MSTDLLDQLAAYGADHRARQARVERHEILQRVGELTEPDDERHTTEPTPRSRFTLVAAAVVVALLVAGLALVAAGRDPSEPSDVPGTDLIRSTEPSVPSTSVESTPAPTTTTSTTTPAGEPEAAPATVPAIEANASAVEPVGVAGAPFEEFARSVALGAWNDGFLFASVVGGIQVSVELSDEIVARFTTDGETWTPIEVTAPTDMELEDVFIVEDRLVAVGSPPAAPTPAPFRTMIVAATEDLSDWSVQTVPDVVETLQEVSIAANGDGWVAHIEPDLCQVDRDGQGVSCSWPPEPEQGYDVGEGPPLTWAAAWGGEPTVVAGSVADEGVTVTALSTGFLAQHDEIEFSSDGVTWTTVSDAPHGASIGGVLPLEDRSTIVFASGSTCETERYLVDRGGQRWERVDLEINGAGASLMPDEGGLSSVNGSTIGLQSLGSAAVIVDDRSGPNVSIGVIERDGFRLTRTDCWMDGTSYARYELVEVSSGAVISAEEASRPVDGTRPVPDWQPFEHLLLSDDEADDVLLDPATGHELMTFARDEMSFRDIGFGGSDDVWLLTTTDGREWFVDDLSNFVGRQLPFVAAVRNGDVALVGSGDEWLRYDLDG